MPSATAAVDSARARARAGTGQLWPQTMLTVLTVLTERSAFVSGNRDDSYWKRVTADCTPSGLIEGDVARQPNAPHAALRRGRGFGKSMRSAQRLIDDPHVGAVAQIEQPSHRILRHAKHFGELKFIQRRPLPHQLIISECRQVRT